MNPADLERVVEIAQSLKDAPHWPLAAYRDALDPNAAVRRIALVVEEFAGGGRDLSEPPQRHLSGAKQAAEKGQRSTEKHPSAAKALVDVAGFMYGLKPVPFTGFSFSAVCKAHADFAGSTYGLNPVPFSEESFSKPGEGWQGGKVVGFVVTSLMPPQSELETIAVAAEGQRRGMGRRLFVRLVEELKSAGIQEVILEVRAGNLPAIGLYRALGFSETGRRPRYYADPEEDALLLGLRLE